MTGSHEYVKGTVKNTDETKFASLCSGYTQQAHQAVPAAVAGMSAEPDRVHRQTVFSAANSQRREKVPQDLRYGRA